MAPLKEAVYATLLMTDAYLPGAMVLGHSLKDKGARAKLVAFVTLDNLSADTITELKTVYDDVVPVMRISNRTPANLYLMDRPDLVSTFTKIELWRQTQYRQIVYIDADVVALRAPNELLVLDGDFAAVPDIGWPDCFNSGVMVLKPNMGDYYSLLALADRGISFDGADQGLLNMHFRDWERLSFTYNCTPSGNYQYVPAYRHFQSSINMIHFIGKDKPWTLGRENKYSNGLLGEMLGLWWTVYDKHYRQPKTAYYSGQYRDQPSKVQDYVAGEETMFLPGYSASQPEEKPPVPELVIHEPDEAKPTSTEKPMGDPPTPSEQIRHEDYTPTPTAIQRRFSAPKAEWDAQRAPPPEHSKPEASNFPSQVYEMSEDRNLFTAPASYPEAPRDMYYQVPEKPPALTTPKPVFPWEGRLPRATRVFPATPPPPAPASPPQETLPASEVKPEPGSAATEPASDPKSSEETTSQIPESPPVTKLKQIFPWESRAPKATRVFPAPPPPPAPLTPPQEPQPEAADSSTAAAEENEAKHGSPPKSPPTGTVSSPDPWQTYTRSNAWDEVPEIDQYVRSFHQARRAKIQVLHHTPSAATDDVEPVLTSDEDAVRRPSIKVTDFPSEIERPSLPVTPAPIRRPSFWGEERDSLGELPTAEGVPRQEEWNPIAKLEELQRRQSEVLESGPQLETKEMPKRAMPESGSAEAAAVEKAVSPSMAAPKPLKPILKTPHFETPKEDGQSSEDAAETTATGLNDEPIPSNENHGSALGVEPVAISSA